jgi:hypothetical protein
MEMTFKREEILLRKNREGCPDEIEPRINADFADIKSNPRYPPSSAVKFLG